MSPRGDTRYYTEIPSSLKQVARLVVRGFYTLEDALIIDMLVRNPCMKEDDIAELLRFERKQLRARIATLRNDKFIQTRLKMETGPDAKAQKVSYYFINYKTFVNVVKYKLDLMRKRMETEERDATSRASFKCTNCFKTFTDLEADHLFDVYTGEFRCTICRRLVEEDAIEMPKNSRLMLARFNEQLHPLYDLLREVEGITLAPELLEPEPVDIDTIRGLNKSNGQRPDTMQWSGEATRNKGFAVEETRVNVTIGEDDDTPDFGLEAKARPIWMSESTVLMENHKEMETTSNETPQTTLQAGFSNNSRNKRETEDIMSVLLQYEDHPEKRKPTAQWMLFLSEANSAGTCSGNENCDEDKKIASTLPSVSPTNSESEIDDDVPVVYVCGCPFSLNELTDILISQMTQLEKESYIHVCQDYYNSIYE